ncbi:hypothetical protein ABK040_015630 [Willaertia magna]
MSQQQIKHHQPVILACGENFFYQLGLSDNNNRMNLNQLLFKELINNNEFIEDISCGFGYTFFKTNKNSVFSCGINPYGQLGISSLERKRRKPVRMPTDFLLDDDSIDKVSCGWGFTMILTKKGKLYSTGYNYHGQLGLGDNFERDRFELIDFKESVKKVATGASHSIILTRNGSVYGCGHNNDGRLGVGHFEHCNAFNRVNFFDNQNLLVEDIVCGEGHTAFITTTGKLFLAGRNDYGQLGSGNNKNFQVPQKIKLPNNLESLSTVTVSKVSCGWAHTLVLLNDHTVFGCGWNDFGQLGLANNNACELLEFTKINFKKEISNIICGQCYSIFISKDNTIFVSGENRHGQLGIGDKPFSDYHSSDNIYQPIEMKLPESLMENTNNLNYKPYWGAGESFRNIKVISSPFCNGTFLVVGSISNEIYQFYFNLMKQVLNNLSDITIKLK